MPLVINPQVLPPPPPATPGIGAYLGKGLGEGIGRGTDFLLQALLNGQLGPQPQYQVQPTGNIPPTAPLQLPNGQQFVGTPDAARRLIPQQMQSYQQLVNKGILPPSSLPQGLSAVPTGQAPWRFQPNLTRQLQQMQLAEAPVKLAAEQAQLKNMEAGTDWMRAQLPGGASGAGSTPHEPSVTPPLDPALSFNDYLQQRAAARQNPNVSYTPQMGFSGKGMTLQMKPSGNTPLDATQLTKIQDAYKTTRDLENIIQSADQFMSQFGPLNPMVQINTFANIYRQTFGQRGLDAFLRQWGNAELNYRKSQEGLRLVMGGQSLALKNFPNPAQQSGENFMETAKQYLGEGITAMDDSLQLAHENGANVSHFKPYLSPLLQQTPASNYIAQGGASASPSVTSPLASTQSSPTGRNFASEQAAIAAHLPAGTEVTINGRRARITP